VPLDLGLVTPPQDGIRGELRPIVRNNHVGLPAALHQGRKLTRYSPPRDRSIWDRSQAFARDVIDHVENAEALAIGELVMDEIQ